MAYPWRDRLTADNLRRRTVMFIIIDNVGNETGGSFSVYIIQQY